MASILSRLPHEHEDVLFAGRAGALRLPDGRVLLVQPDSSSVVDDAVEPPDNEVATPDETVPSRRPAFMDRVPLFGARAPAQGLPFQELWRRREEPDRYVRQDPYTGGAIRVAQALRHQPDALALSYQLQFGHADDPEAAYQLKQAVQGIADAAQMFGVPVLAGSLQMGSPEPLVTILAHGGRIVFPGQFQSPGDAIVVLGRMTGDLSGSLYIDTAASWPPPIDLIVEGRLLELLRQAPARSSNGIGRGGLLVTLARCCTGQLGARTALANTWDGLGPAAVLFGEAQSRMLLSVAVADVPELVALAKPLEVPVETIGVASGDHLVVDGWIDIDLKELSHGRPE